MSERTGGAGIARRVPRHQMEFQAVLLAGGTGTRLYPLTEGVPKSLLTVANRPLIAYQLLLLEKAGFKEVLVATSKNAKTELENYLAQVHKGSIMVDIHVVDEESETGDVLRALKDKIKRDFLVISGDLITDVNLHHLADVHRINDATCTVLLRAPKVESKAPGAAPAKPGKAEGAIVDFVALDEKRTRLLCLESAADVEEKLVLPKSLLIKHPNVFITNKMLDAHLYIFSRWVLDLLDERPKITSIKTELLPFLLRYQFSRKRIPGQPLRSTGDDADVSYDVGSDGAAASRCVTPPLAHYNQQIFEVTYCIIRICREIHRIPQSRPVQKRLRVDKGCRPPAGKGLAASCRRRARASFPAPLDPAPAAPLDPAHQCWPGGGATQNNTK